MNILVYYPSSQDYSILKEKELPSGENNENDKIVVTYKRKTYDAVILKKSYDLKWLKTLTVTKEGQIIYDKSKKENDTVRIKAQQKADRKTEKEATQRLNEEMINVQSIFDGDEVKDGEMSDLRNEKSKTRQNVPKQKADLNTEHMSQKGKTARKGVSEKDSQRSTQREQDKDQEREERERKAQEHAAQEKNELASKTQEKKEYERQAKEDQEKTKREKKAREKEERDRKSLEREARNKQERERKSREREAKEKEVREKEVRQRKARDTAAKEKEERERKARERAAEQKEAREKEERERKSRERATEQKEAREKEERERKARERSFQEKEALARIAYEHECRVREERELSRAKQFNESDEKDKPVDRSPSIRDEDFEQDPMEDGDVSEHSNDKENEQDTGKQSDARNGPNNQLTKQAEDNKRDNAVLRKVISCLKSATKELENIHKNNEKAVDIENLPAYHDGPGKISFKTLHIDKVDFQDAVRFKENNPREMIRRLMKSFVGEENLFQMVPLGNKYKIGIPKDIRNTVYSFSKKYFRDNNVAFDLKRFNSILSNQLTTLRNPKPEFANDSTKRKPSNHRTSRKRKSSVTSDENTDGVKWRKSYSRSPNVRGFRSRSKSISQSRSMQRYSPSFRSSRSSPRSPKSLVRTPDKYERLPCRSRESSKESRRLGWHPQSPAQRYSSSKHERRHDSRQTQSSFHRYRSGLDSSPISSDSAANIIKRYYGNLNASKKKPPSSRSRSPSYTFDS